MKIVGVTKCPTGIAHTYMAAERLERTGEELGYEVKIEAQGSQRTENPLTMEEIADADYVIIAADVTIDGRERFGGKKVLETPIHPVISNPGEIFFNLEYEATLWDGEPCGDEQVSPLEKGIYIRKDKEGSQMLQQLMNGASHMIPFVVVGGMFISLSLAFGGEASVHGLMIPSVFWKKMNAIGYLAFDLMYPILSGFIAYSIAGRASLAPAMIGAAIAMDGEILGTGTGTGFLGCIIVGYLAGYLVKWMNSWKVSGNIRSMMPIFVIPLVGVGMIALLFVCILGKPVAIVMEFLNSLLSLLSAGRSTAVLLGIVLGAMIGIDMGGPVNKVAFLFGVASIADGNPGIMGIAAAAIPVAPLAVGLAILFDREKFTEEEQNTLLTTILMGMFGISEGAIPFATADPKCVIPSVTIGSAVSGALAAVFKITVAVPHGGPVIGALGASNHVLLYLLSIAAGTVTGAFLILALKKQ